MTIMGDTLKMVATDSYRLAVKETKLDHALETEVQAIVPVKALGEVARLASTMGQGDIEVAIGENQVLFKLSDPAGDVWIASRLIEGQFPNYKQLLPDTFDHEVTLDRDEFMATARRVSLLAQKNAPLRLTFAENRSRCGRSRRTSARPRSRWTSSSPARRSRSGSTRATSSRASRPRWRRGAAALHQPPAARPHQRSAARRFHVSHHADPPEQLNDVTVNGPLPLGAFLKLAGVASPAATPSCSSRRATSRVNGEVETRRGRTLQPGDVVAVGGQEYRVCSSPA